MDYCKIYASLVETRKQMSRTKCIGTAYEKHHIIPKSLGGTDVNNNLVLLTPREHYIAHWLLYKMSSGSSRAKMAYAFFMMCSNNPNQARSVSSKDFERARLAVNESASGKNHPLYGKVLWTQEQKDEISARQSGSGNPMFGKDPWNKGLTKETDATLQKISESKKGCVTNFYAGRVVNEDTRKKISKSHKGKTVTEETKLKLRQLNTGKVLTEETKRKMSKSRTGVSQKEVKCPYCSTQGGISAMKRWHFDKCKDKYGN